VTRQLRLDFTSPDPLWRELEDRARDDARQRGFDDHFGVCPECGEPGLCLNVNRDHWFVCRDHRVKWYAGSNLFSAWRDEDPARWVENDAEFCRYRMVRA
jgi:hypothetical protein